MQLYVSKELQLRQSPDSVVKEVLGAKKRVEFQVKDGGAITPTKPQIINIEEYLNEMDRA